MINLIIIGKDLPYCKALCKSISQLTDDIIITLDGESEKYNSLDIYKDSLIAYEGNFNIKSFSEKRVRFVENHEEINKEKEKYYNIYKYKNVNNIIKDIYMAYQEIKGFNYYKRENIKSSLICVFSSSGGCGKTSISIGLAKEFARFREKNILYLNLEECDSSRYFLGNYENKYKKSLDSLIYNVFRDENINIKSYLNKTNFGMEYFLPYSGKNPLKSLTQKEICKFIDAICKRESFHYIIVDLSSSLDEASLWFLKESDKIIYIDEIGNEDFLNNRDDNLLDFLKIKVTHKIEDKLIRVKNKQEGENLDEEGKKKIIIEKDCSSFIVIDGIIDINLERVFGRGMSLIADKIELET